MNRTRRRFVRDTLGAGLAFGIATGTGYCVARGPQVPAARDVTGDPYRLVDPELIPFLKTLGKSNLNKENFRVLRQIPPPTPSPHPAPQPVVQLIPGPTGGPDVPLTIVDPNAGKKSQPVLLYFHGGGYTTGSSAMEVPFLQNIAQNCDCIVISVDYRLAPEAPFPAALDDNYTALRWIYTNADTLGIDKKRIAVGGMCSGGGHAAALVIAARNRKEVPLIFQMLLQPMLDDRTGSSRRVPRSTGHFVWTAESNSFGWTSLLGVPAGSPNVPAGSVPARVGDLAGLPATFIAVGSIDLFVDEVVEYSRRLIDVGVPTELHVSAGGYHGFFTLVPEASISIRFNNRWISALQRAFARS
jgi:acetyl esterase/lipase